MAPFLKTIILLPSLMFMFLFPAKADEGMWLLSNLENNYKAMRDAGLELTPDEIYSVNHSSLKDAIVSLRFCTAEIISPDGLMLTNHHCSYGAIQSHSSVDHDYLSDGFWAKNRSEELPAEGFTASILIRMENVTEEILNELTEDMDPMEWATAIQEKSKALMEAAEDGNFYSAQVRSMLEGNAFYLFVYETYRDVRLVGAPPSSIGKYGGDADNWEWPRHTGDFSLLRVYMSPEGEPADYSEDNVPYKPRHFLPVSLKGVEEGDYAMVMGFPGSTQRYLTSYGIELAQKQSNPSRIKIRTKILDIMRKHMDADPKVRIQYASKYSRIANYWKYFIGQNEGLERLETVIKKRAQESDFQQWANENPERKEKYGHILPELDKVYETLSKYDEYVQYLNEAAFGSEAVQFSYRFRALENALDADEVNEEEVDKIAAGIRSRLDAHFKDYHRPLDQEVFTATAKLFYKNVPNKQLPGYIKDLGNKYGGKWQKYGDKAFKKSIFPYRNEIEDFLDKPKLKKLQKDPIFEFFNAVLDGYYDGIRAERHAALDKEEKLMRILVEGIMEMNPDKNFYPDANSTIRLTYGNVEPYTPRDAVKYKYYTTLEGVLEKWDSTDKEFVLPMDLVELYENKDYGRYGSDGELVVNFITNNDITGGNSGSPVMNSKGHLIGVAFDGNWEAMTGDLVFDAALKRCINVDIRYVLFVMDKMAGAKNLIDELTIVQ